MQSNRNAPLDNRLYRDVLETSPQWNWTSGELRSIGFVICTFLKKIRPKQTAATRRRDIIESIEGTHRLVRKPKVQCSKHPFVTAFRRISGHHRFNRFAIASSLVSWTKSLLKSSSKLWSDPPGLPSLSLKFSSASVADPFISSSSL